MGGNARFRQAQSTRITQAKNLIDDFLKSATNGKFPKVISANYMSTLLSATKKRDRNKVLATDRSAKADFMNNSDVMQKYTSARKAIVHLSKGDLNKYFKDEWQLFQKWTK